jgi:hypothetical protein
MQPEGSLLCSQETAICPYPSHINPVHAHPTDLISISILSSYLCLCLPKWSLSLRFTHQTPVCTYPLPHTWHISSPSHFSWFDPQDNIYQAVKITTLFTLQFLQTLTTLLLLGPYSPYYQHLQPMFFLQYETPSFTPIQNDRENYISVYFNLSTSRDQTEWQKILDRTVPRLFQSSVCSWFPHEHDFDLSELFPDIWTLLHFRPTPGKIRIPRISLFHRAFQFTMCNGRHASPHNTTCKTNERMLPHNHTWRQRF